MNLTLPTDFIASLKDVHGFNEAEFIAVHALQKQVTAVRINPMKVTSNDSLTSVLNWDEPLQASKVPWSSLGYYLSKRPAFIFDPYWHAGAYYVQEPSSMFLEEIFKQLVDTKRKLKVLDLCAAPGGKSTLVQSLINSESILVSNEAIASRVSMLKENCIKWGGSNGIITNNDPSDFAELKGYFDVLIADAPCSGSGLFRKMPEAINEWSHQQVLFCSTRQQRILADALPALAEDGLLIYSTCSYSKQENEDVCDWLLSNFSLIPVSLMLDNQWQIVQSETNQHKAPCYRFYPDKLDGEGFFVACFKKTNEVTFTYPRIKKPTAISKELLKTIHPQLRKPEEMEVINYDEKYSIISGNLYNDYALLKNQLTVRYAGTPIGKIIFNELIPEHAFALSVAIHTQIPSLQLNKNQALLYLKRKDLQYETSQKGWSLAQYNQLNLGWVKILQNRINNYFPKEWRILKDA